MAARDNKNNQKSQDTNIEESEDGKRRLQLELPPEGATRLKRINELSGHKTSAETIRNALKVYLWFLEKNAAGYEVQVTKDGKVIMVEFVF